MIKNKRILQVMSLVLAFTITTMSMSSIAYGEGLDEFYLNNQVIEEDVVIEEDMVIEEKLILGDMESNTIGIRSMGMPIPIPVDVVQPAIEAAKAVGKVIGGYIIVKAAEHTKNKRKSTSDKHTKPRPGRDSEKKKQNPKWKPRK